MKADNILSAIFSSSKCVQTAEHLSHSKDLSDNYCIIVDYIRDVNACIFNTSSSRQSAVHVYSTGGSHVPNSTRIWMNPVQAVDEQQAVGTGLLDQAVTQLR